MSESNADLKTGYCWTSVYGWLDTQGGPLMVSDHRLGIAPIALHVAHPDTKRRTHELVEVTGLLDHLERIKPVPATADDVELVHEKQYVKRVARENCLPKGGDCGDGVSPFGPGGYEIGLLSCGGALEMLKAVWGGKIKNGYSVRHHAEPQSGMGFCMFNNTAICAQYALTVLGLKRVAIVDIDVHHGNGAEKAFWNTKDVLTISIHQDRCFPPTTGFETSRGGEDAFGFNLNIPLPPGSGNGAYAYALDSVVLPALEAYRPELILVASDPNIMDPLARQCVTADGFVMIVSKLMQSAAALCGDKLVLIQEGGYSPYYVPICVHRMIETLAGVKTLEEDPYRHLFVPMYGQDLETRQKEVVDGIVGHLAELS